MTLHIWEGTIHKKQAEIHQPSEKLANQWLRTCYEKKNEPVLLEDISKQCVISGV